MLGSFFVRFFSGAFRCGEFFKKGVGRSAFSAEISFFSPGVFRPFINEESRLVSVNGIHGFFTWKRFYFRV